MGAEQLDLVIIQQRSKEQVSGLTQLTALEGPSCAGKSTILERLNRTGMGTILEYSEYVASATLDFPKFPPKSDEDAKQALRFFLDLETRRKKDVENLGKSKVTLDRSIFTLLAFECGASRLTGINILPWATGELIAKNESLVWPNHIVYLDVSTEITQQRAIDGGIKIPAYMFNRDFNNGFREFFINLKNRFPNLVSIVDGSGNQEEVFYRVQEIINLRQK